MKVGMRKPSIKKSIKARTTGKLKRQFKRSINPLYGKKGMGWVNNPKKAAYNKIYNKTTFGVNDVVRAASVTNTSKNKSKTSKSYSYTASTSFTPKYNMEQLKDMLGVTTQSGKKMGFILLITFIFIFSANPILIVIALLLDIYVLVKVCSKKYRLENKWFRIMYFYEQGKTTMSSDLLRSLPYDEKEKESYKKMQEVLSDEYSIDVHFDVDVDKQEDQEIDPLIGKKLLAREEKIIYSYGAYDEFIVVDTETTGLDAAYDKIIEISAIKYKNNEEVDRFERLVNPQIDIPDFITNINRIDNDMVKDKQTIDDVMPEFLEFIGNSPLVAHNAKFDIRFLNANLVYMDKKLSNDVIDTLTISRKIYKDLKNHKLPTIKEYFNMDVESHRASDDCLVCARIYMDYCGLVNKKAEVKNDGEQNVYDSVVKILNDNDRRIEYLKIKHTSVYMDFYAFTNFLRVKLNGNKKYILVNIEDNELDILGVEYEKTSKSESFINRVKYNSSEDVLKLKQYILEEYDKAIEKANINDKVVLDYLVEN